MNVTGHRANLETLIRAALSGRLAVMDCQDKRTKEPVSVLVAISDTSDGSGDVEFVPFARLFEGNPYDELNPPDPENPGQYLED